MSVTYVVLGGLLVAARRALVVTLGGAPFPVPPGLLRLLDRMCALLGATFAVQAVRYAVWTHPAVELALLGRSLGCPGACAADFLLDLGTEFAPCALGLLLLRPTSVVAERPAPRRRLSHTERQRLTETRAETEQRYSAV